MEELKDNVCEEETTRTEQGSSVEEEKGSAVLGKFKNVDALARAYEALQSEFTKRSQRLKELEKAQREADNTPTGGLEQGGEKDRGTGVEKLRAAAKAKKEREKAFDSFVAELESEGSPKIVENGNGQPDSLHTSVAEEHGFSAASSADLGVGVEESPTQKISEINGTDSSKGEENGVREETAFNVIAKEKGVSSNALYEAVQKDEKARMRIIGDYLASIRRSDAPLMKGGFGVMTTPSVRAKNISEAGEMALQFFRRDKSNAK